MTTGNHSTQLTSPRNARLALTFAVLGACATALSGLAACSTVEGAGEDLEYVGESISDESEDAQD